MAGSLDEQRQAFRALEVLAVLFDIGIDEEQFKACNLRGARPIRRVPIDGDKPWDNHRYLVFGGTERVRDRRRIDLEVAPKESWPEQLRPFLPDLAQATEALNGGVLPRGVSACWRRLFRAKHARALLQGAGSTPAFEALDDLGLVVLHHLPVLPARQIASRGVEHLEVLLMRVLFLLEAAACFRGYQSISMADEALETINDSLVASVGLSGPGHTPYEGVALYNKALGHLHVRDHDLALRKFEDILQASGSHYYEQPVSPEHAFVRWPDCEALFTVFVQLPALLQKADTLLNLQRSYEAKKALEDPLFDSAPLYKAARKLILESRAENDRAREEVLPPVDWGRKATSHNLRLERAAVDTERAIRNSCVLAGEGKGREALLQMRLAGSSLRTRLRLACSNRSEVDEAALSWVFGLRSAMTLLKLQESLETRAAKVAAAIAAAVQQYLELEEVRAGRLSEIVLGLAVDQEYRDHKTEVRKAAIRGLSDLWEAADQHPTLEAQARSLLVRLLRDLVRANDGGHGEGGIPQCEIASWRRRLDTLENRLPEPDKLAELRAFLSYGFVHGLGRSDGASPERDPRERDKWDKCDAEDTDKRHRCAGPTDSDLSDPCGRDTVRRTLSFCEGGDDRRPRHPLDLVIGRNRGALESRLFQQRNHAAGWHFVVLQRWNSFTPAMRASEGGGYFLYFAKDDKGGGYGPIDTGIVIDPGYGFIKNFLSEGFGICDISAIVVTHDHPDHLADFEGLVNLLLEVNKNRSGGGGRGRKIVALVSGGAFARLEPCIESCREVFQDTVVLEPAATPNDGYNVGRAQVRACQALHSDASDLPYRNGYDSVGVIFEADGQILAGIPSDTKWSPEIAATYADTKACELVCLHLGSFAPERFRLLEYFNEAKTQLRVLDKKQQLYLPGVVWFLEALFKSGKLKNKTVMVILSEFGEELAKGVRIDVAQRLQGYCDHRREERQVEGENLQMGHEEKDRASLVVVPGDVGLRVDPVRHTIYCTSCLLPYPWESRMTYEAYGDAEQIAYVCRACCERWTREQREQRYREREPLARGQLPEDYGY